MVREEGLDLAAQVQHRARREAADGDGDGEVHAAPSLASVVPGQLQSLCACDKSDMHSPEGPWSGWQLPCFHHTSGGPIACGVYALVSAMERVSAGEVGQGTEVA